LGIDRSRAHPPRSFISIAYILKNIVGASRFKEVAGFVETAFRFR